MTSSAVTCGQRGVALGGFMGTGKSTVGPFVADRVGLPFVDLDRAVEADAGATIVRLFASEGEAAFRRREARVLDAVLNGGPAVIALGGGTLHHGGNLDRVRQACDIVILDAPWDTVTERIGGDRPLAGAAGALYAHRVDGYRAAGPFVSCEGCSPEQVADAVVAMLLESP